MYIRQLLAVAALLLLGANSMPQYAGHFPGNSEALQADLLQTSRRRHPHSYRIWNFWPADWKLIWAFDGW